MGNTNFADKMLMYAENHNQSISGGRSFAEILFGEIREGSPDKEKLLLRCCSLHKMIRLITMTIGGRAYLNFMGNEFWHPERIEFPMPSNNFSVSLANRRWDLLANEGLHLNSFTFDKLLLNTDERKYGGQGLLKDDQYSRTTTSQRSDGLRNSLEVPLPSRIARWTRITSKLERRG